MKDVVRYIAAFSSLFAGWPLAYKVLLILFLLDIVSGITASVYSGNKITSKNWTKGICRKLSVALGVAAAHVISTVVNLPLGETLSLIHI